MAILMTLRAHFQAYRQPSRCSTLPLVKACSTILRPRPRLKSCLSPLALLGCIWLMACVPGGVSHCSAPEAVSCLRLISCCMSGP